MNQKEPIFFTTDFCLNGYKRQTTNYTHIDPPRYYSYGRGVNPDEFFLAENLATKRNRPHTSLRSRMELPKTTDPSEIQKQQQKALQTAKSTSSLSYRFQIETIPESLMSKLNFYESKLRAYISSGAATFDEIRPHFEGYGFFPYTVQQNIPRKYCLSLSNISLSTEYLEFPFESVDHTDIFIDLVRLDNGALNSVSNIVQIQLKPTKRGFWVPLVFNEYDILVYAKKEVSLYCEVVCTVRVPSPTKPFALKTTKIAEGQLKLVSYTHGEFIPIEDQVINLQLTRNKKRPPDSEAVNFNFEIISKPVRYNDLPKDFITSTESIMAYDMVYKYLRQAFDPFNSRFNLLPTELYEVLMFWEITKNDRAMQRLLKTWDKNDVISLLRLCRAYYMCTKLVLPMGPFPAYSIMESKDSKTEKCANSVEHTKVFSDLGFKPFHTDELRKSLILDSAAAWD